MNDITTALYLDIETVPARRPDILEEIRAECSAKLEAELQGVAPPANYKSEETIAKWWADSGNAKKAALLAGHAAEVDQGYRKTALDGAFGSVCVIGLALGDAEPVTLHSADDEAALLERLGAALRPINAFATCVVGHNVIGFDLRFLVQRAIVHRQRPAAVIQRAAQAKPWEDTKAYDTMVQWAGVGRTVSLDKLCRALDIPSPKGQMDGSQVWDFVQAGRIEEVARYCAADVAAVRAVHRRMTFAD